MIWVAANVYRRFFTQADLETLAAKGSKTARKALDR